MGTPQVRLLIATEQDVTPIDEALVGAGSGIGGFDERENARIARRLTQAKDPATGPFAEGIDSINRVYNRPSLGRPAGSGVRKVNICTCCCN